MLVVSLRKGRKWTRAVLLLITAIALTLPLPSLLQLNFFQSAAAAGAPTISSVSPASGPPQGGNSVIINGTNFTNKLALSKVSVGHTHTCAISENGYGYCWGDNTNGQLGDNTTTQRTTPVSVFREGALAGKKLKDIKAAGYHTCAVTTDNLAYCWGRNTMGQLGDNTTTQRTTPVAVYTAGALNGLTINQLTVSWNDTNTDGHTCVVASNQRAYCWGRNNWGQLGNNTTSTGANPAPIAVNNTVNTTKNGLYNKNVAEISAGFNLTCARSTDGTATCWGLNNSGELGTNNTTAYRYPRPLYVAGALSGKTILRIAAGGSHACAIASDQKVYCWGYGTSGQIGNGSNSNQRQAQAVNTTGVLSGKNIASLELGAEISCVVTTDNRSACWGQGANGSLGNGATANSNIPVAPQAGSAGLTQGTITSITTGRSTTCVETTASINVACWGLNTYGQVGDNSTATRTTPTPVNVSAYTLGVTFDTTPASSVTYVNPNQINAVAPAHSVGTINVTVTDPEGQIVSLPAGYTYQDPAPTITSISPTSGPVAGGETVTINGTNFFKGKTITDLTVGMAHTCAAVDGKAYCWGNNSSGQLGTGNTSNSTTPVAVNSSGALAGKTVTSISAGPNYTCAVASGAAYCWGSNTDGKLGTGNTTSSTVPVAVNTSGVLAGKTVTKVVPKQEASCAIASGAAYCWGSDSTGALGNGAAGDSLAPTSVDTSGVLSGKTVTDIAAGQYVVCVVANGAAYCWGDGQHGGQLGNGTSTEAPSPVAVSTSGALAGKTVTTIDTEAGHVCALANNASFCWGFNNSGLFGNGTDNTTVFASPTPVASNTIGPIQHLTTGYDSTCAHVNESIYCWGSNTSGEFGNGTSNNSSTTPTPANLTSIPQNTPPLVSFDNTPATSVTFVSSTQLTAVAPAHAAGVVDVTVTNPDNQSATLANSYTYITPIVAPGAPTNLTTTPAEEAVDLTWTAPIDDGGSAITDYIIEYSSNGGTTWQTFTHPPSAATNISVTGLTPGTTYTFRVKAINSAGTGPASATATDTPIYISVTSSATVSINATPTDASRTSSSSHNITTSTNAPNGFNLSLAMAGTNRSLVNGGQTIGATSGTFAAPGALGMNTWGFRVPGTGGFGTGGTTETNVANSAYTWAGVPASTSPVVIRSTSAPAENNLTTVLYGMRINMQKPSGTYSGTVIYTAVAN